MKYMGSGLITRRLVSNTVITLLVIANILVGALNINTRKPKCISDDCNRVRVAGTHYCTKHTHLMNEREICQKVISRSSN